jgi:hypothetical protein
MSLNPAYMKPFAMSALLSCLLASASLMAPTRGFAQLIEPPLMEDGAVVSPFGQGLRQSLSVTFGANNFGFGLDGEYARVLSPLTEALLRVGFTGLRDVSEQTYTDYFFGQQVIPNKYQRGLAIPLTVGVRQRLFAGSVKESYRFQLSASAGPVFAFSYPYFDDYNGNGYRERFFDYYENTYDVFTGLKDGEWKVGLAGEASIGIDFGADFKRLTRLRFGYSVYRFAEGIQMMQPNQPVPVQNPGPEDYPYVLNPDGTIKMQPFFDSQSVFGTPFISLSFGRMW